MPNTATYYDRINQAVQGFNNQLNINATRDLQREQLGLQRLQDTHTRMMELYRNKRADEMQSAQLDIMKSAEARAQAAEGRAESLYQMSLPGLKFKNLRFENAMDKSDIDIGRWFTASPHVLKQIQTNPEMQQTIANIYGPNTTLNPQTLKVVDQTGKPIRLSGYEQASKGSMLIGAIESFIDPATAITERQSQLQQNLKDYQKAYKNLDSRNVARKSELMSQIANTKTQLADIDTKLSPAKLLQFYRQKDRLLQLASNIAVANMADPSYINLLSNSMAQNSKILNELQKQLYKADGTTGKTQQHYAVLRDDKGNIAHTALLNTPKNMPIGMSPSTIDPSLKGYVWAKDAELEDKLKDKSKTGEITLKDLRTQIEREYSKLDPRGQFILTPELSVRRRNAEQALGDAWKMYQDAGQQPDIDLKYEAINWAENLEKTYFDNLDKIESQSDADIAVELRQNNIKPTKEAIKKVKASKLERLNQWWMSESYVKELPPRQK